MPKLTTRGPGRPPGSPNKINRDMKEMTLKALNMAGGEHYLLRQAEANPVAFMSLCARMAPLQLTGVAGGAPIFIVTGVDRGDDRRPAIDGRAEPPAPEPPPPPPEPAPISRVPSFAPPSGPQAPRAPRPHPLPELPDDSTAPVAVPANQLLGARTAVTESGVRVRSLGAPWNR